VKIAYLQAIRFSLADVPDGILWIVRSLRAGTSEAIPQPDSNLWIVVPSLSTGISEEGD
jgi:hypothetical protein